MGLESATYISGLNSSNPVGATDQLGAGDDHLRLIKSTLLNTFPSITGAVTLTHTQINDAAQKGAANTFTAANNFQALTCTTFTSTGIDDNATVESLQVADNVLTVGTGTGSPYIIGADSTQTLNISSDGFLTGSYILLRGSGRATEASDILMGAAVGANPAAAWDSSGNSWNWHSNDFTGIGALTCGALTSTGIDDNATGEVFQLTDSIGTMGPVSGGYSLFGRDNSQFFVVGAGAGSGAEIVFYGGATASVAGDVQFRDPVNGTTLYFDYSAGNWDFQANAIATTGALTCGAFTSTGIDDNAGGTTLTLVSNGASFGTGTGDSYIGGVSATATAYFGSDTGLSGSYIGFRASSHASAARDIIMGANVGATPAATWDYSALAWDYHNNDISTTGDITGANLTGTIQTAAQPNITSLGTLTSLATSGNITSGGLITSGGQVKPDTDNAYLLGGAAFRWTTVYATNGTINTSDARLKDYESIDGDRAARAIRGLDFVHYRWKDGSPGTHYGVLAQQTADVFKRQGLPSDGMIYRDEDADSYGLAYHELVGVLGAAVQKIMQRLDALEGGSEHVVS